MQKYTLSNGLTILFEKRPTRTVAVEVTVNTGSNNETKKVFGISHFIEHMLFEGTKKRPNSRLISDEIEKLGGELNAYTSNERTSFFVKVLNKHFDKALDILSDIIINPLFDDDSIEKERKVILKEIDMVSDEPRFHQWVLFMKALYKKHPSKNPAYGSVETVGRITKKDILEYYASYYKPNNMSVSIVGNVKDVRNKASEYFKCFKESRIIKKPRVKEPLQKRVIRKIEKRKLQSSYMVLGYKTVPRISRSSYALDIIHSILARGQSGVLFEEIRNKLGLAYEVGAQHEAGLDYGFFAVYLNTDKKNIPKITEIILKEIQKLKNLSEKDLKKAKIQIEGTYHRENDDNFKMADNISFWHQVGDAGLSNKYVSNIQKVKLEDITFVINKFLNKNYTIAVIEQE